MPLGNLEWLHKLLLQMVYTKHFTSTRWVDLRFQIKHTHPHLVIQHKKASPPTEIQVATSIFLHSKSRSHIWSPQKSEGTVLDITLANYLCARLSTQKSNLCIVPSWIFFQFAFFSNSHLKKNIIKCLEQQRHFFFLNTATNFKPISQGASKELITADTKRSGSFCVWESTLNFKFSQSLFSCFRETCPILSSSDSSPDISVLQHLNWLHPWNTLWLGKTTNHRWESRARRLTWKNREKQQVAHSLFFLEMWNWPTARLGWHRDVEMMLNLMRCSRLRVCPISLNPKRSWFQ